MNFYLTRLLLLASGIALPATACARTNTDPPETALSDYVIGRFAVEANDLDEAAARYRQALAADPKNALLQRRAFEVALIAGEEAEAARLAAALPRVSAAETQAQLRDLIAGAAQGDTMAVRAGMAQAGRDGFVTLLDLTGAFKRSDWDAADAARSRLGLIGADFLAAPIVHAWTLFGRGQHEEALAKLVVEPGNELGRTYIAEHRGHMLAALGRADEAARVYDTLFDQAGASAGFHLRLRAAAALQAAGDTRAALRFLEGDGGGNAILEEATERLRDGEALPAGVRTPAGGLAALWSRLSADFSRQRGTPVAIIYARLASFLARDDANQVILSELLARADQSAAALEALDRVGPDSLFAREARTIRAALLTEAGRDGAGLALLEAAASGPSATAEDWVRLGEFHRIAERYDEAIAAYDRAIDLTPDIEDRHWTLFFLRGSARERAGDWEKAEPDLRRALELAPSDATVLNYLGYSLLDRGIRLDEARKFIEAAIALRPGDGAIIDSLGWVHYKSGRYEEAVETLERAVAEAPGDPTINEHLGDAYWQVGRRLEARFRWQAALDSEPEEDQRRRVAAKLEYGLERTDLAEATPQPQ